MFFIQSNGCSGRGRQLSALLKTPLLTREKANFALESRAVSCQKALPAPGKGRRQQQYLPKGLQLGGSKRACTASAGMTAPHTNTNHLLLGQEACRCGQIVAILANHHSLPTQNLSSATSASLCRTYPWYVLAASLPFRDVVARQTVSHFFPTEVNLWQACRHRQLPAKRLMLLTQHEPSNNPK